MNLQTQENNSSGDCKLIFNKKVLIYGDFMFIKFSLKKVILQMEAVRSLEKSYHAGSKGPEHLNFSIIVRESLKTCRTLIIYQLTHTTLRSLELLKHSKIDKNAPTCFGLHGDHLQGAKVSTWLKVTR